MAALASMWKSEARKATSLTSKVCSTGLIIRLAVVAVGAYNVGRISPAFDTSWARGRPWVTNRSELLPRERRYDPPLQVARGSELMAFHLGSTVILLLPPGSTEPTPACRPGREVRLGEALVQPARQGDLSAP